MIDEKLEKLKQKERERYVKTLVESVKKDFNERRKQRLKLESQWILNMKFLKGDQFTHISRRGEVISDDKTYFWQDQNVFNHVSPLVESRLSRYEESTTGADFFSLSKVSSCTKHPSKSGNSAQ